MYAASHYLNFELHPNYKWKEISTLYTIIGDVCNFTLFKTWISSKLWLGLRIILHKKYSFLFLNQHNLYVILMRMIHQSWWM
jgi:hypothetical protein